MIATLFIAAASLVVPSLAGFPINAQPHQSQPGQTGYNDCGTTNSQSSGCQTAYVNNVNDFCLWAPPTPGQTIGDTERIEVAWCTASGHGTRTIPNGAIHSAHYLVTPHYTQVTGTGDFTTMNIAAGDQGGELDPHGADGNGNPVGGLVYSNGVQQNEWTSFISATQYCFRICHDAPDAYLWCQHIYDLQGCMWNEVGSEGPGFDTCQGDGTVTPPGIYVTNGVTSTFQQGDGTGPVPPAHAPGATSNCQAVASIGGGVAAAIANPVVATTAAPSAATTSAVATTAPAANVAASASLASVASVSSASVASVSVASTSAASASSTASASSSASSSTTVASTVSKTTSATALSIIVTSTRASTSVALAAASTSSVSGATKMAVEAVMGLVAVVGLVI